MQVISFKPKLKAQFHLFGIVVVSYFLETKQHVINFEQQQTAAKLNGWNWALNNDIKQKNTEKLQSYL